MSHPQGASSQGTRVPIGALTAMLTLAALALACRDAPEAHPHRTRFELPAYKRMPACALILQLPPDHPPLEQHAAQAIANVGYLAARDCPPALALLDAGQPLRLPLRVEPSGLSLDPERADELLPPLPAEARACLGRAIAAQPPETSNGLSLQPWIVVERRR